MIVLLTGKTEPNLLKELKQFIKKHGWADDLDGEKVTITEK